jgi:hypothetical protein
MTQAKHLYEVRPRKDKHGVDLISDALPFGSLSCGDPNAVANAVRFLRAIYLAKSAFQSMAARTGVEPTLNISRSCAIPSQICARLRVTAEIANQVVCTNRAELRSSTVRICPKPLFGNSPSGPR